ncbi:hypothetical protein LSCM1_01530 [Leishmania martiniquensis]|uniref:Uncharacterized protein n=1 Tax=Leishmania martiniquensis TaxID=1580590 RepID=A0A836KG36_9TRYP|nr:hypothetical protein LSCM1_01530 [Leishmania martiniquensis]
MPSNTDSSDVTHDDRPMSTGASAVAMTPRSGATASDRCASTPFLFQVCFSRRAQLTETRVVGTSPSPSRPHTRPQLCSSRLPLGKHGIINAPVQGGMSAAIGAARPGERKPEVRQVAGQQKSSAAVQEASVSSAARTSDSYALLGNATEPSLSYTWTDSYLDESPSITKARWMRQHTFGPVLQSEGGGSSTVSSIPRGTCDAEATWDAVQARNAAARDSAAGAVRAQQDAAADERRLNSTTIRVAQTRRCHLSAATTGEEGLCGESHHNGGGDRFAVETIGCHPTAIAAASLLPVSRSSASACTSDASTMMATVQHLRRAGLITPIEKPQHPQTAEAAISTADGMQLRSAGGTKGVISSPTADAHFTGVRLSSETRNIVSASRPSSPRRMAPIEGTSNARTSRPSSASRSHIESDGMGGNCSAIGQRYDHLKASRCVPPRGRVLKVLCED